MIKPKSNFGIIFLESDLLDKNYNLISKIAHYLDK